MANIDIFNKKNPIQGFTILEMMIVISLFGLIATFCLPAYHRLQASVNLESSAQELVSALRQAQKKAIDSKDMARHGVHFGVQSYTSFGRDWVNPSYRQDHELPPSLTFSEGADTTIIFERHSGYTTPTSLRLSGSGSETKIVISRTGVISLE